MKIYKAEDYKKLVKKQQKRELGSLKREFAAWKTTDAGYHSTFSTKNGHTSLGANLNIRI